MYFKVRFKMLFTLFFVFVLTKYSNVQGLQKFFRHDYKYIEHSDSFYKIHITHSTWTDAERICLKEGASLLHPNSGKEVLEFINVLSLLHDTESSNIKTIDLSNVITDGLSVTFDGIPLPDLYSEWGPGPCEDSKYPFICKKSADSFEWNYECNVPILGYKYYKETNRCYKFHLEPMNWTDAAETCNNEQSYLAVINAEQEARVLVQLAENTPKEGITRNYVSAVIHLGYRKNNQGDWVTVNGNKLQDSGYLKWSAGQPDNAGNGELCGSMFNYGELNDVGCEAICLFICEHEVESMSSLRGYRLEATRK